MSAAKSFLGTGWGFPPEFNRRSGEVMMVSDEDDVREALHILLSTSPGERIMNPTYGCGLKSMVFESLDESSITRVKSMIKRAILFFEPRITLKGIDIDTEEFSEGIMRIHLDYMVRATNSRSNMVYPFYFREGTNLSL